MARVVRLLTAAAGLLILTACASRPPLIPQATSEAELSETAFFPQQEFQCGPAALATVLHSAGVSASPDDLAKQVYLPARRGSLQPELVAATRRAARIPYIITPELRALRAELDAGRPVLILQNLGFGILPIWHYAVVIGLQPDNGSVVLRSGTVRRHVMTTREFLRTWRLADNWAMVALRPGELPAEVDAGRYLKAVASSERLLPAEHRTAAYRAALRRWPDNPIAQFGLAFSLHQAGDLAAAEPAYLALIEAHPEHAIALNNLADVLQTTGCYGRARDAARRALRIARREHPGLIDAIRETLDQIPPGADTHRCE